MYSTNRGFTLFIAVLIGSLMLAIGFSIFNLAFKELLLSASARDSQVAFYAADTGLECALYYDQNQEAFRITGPGGISITCAGVTTSVTRVAGSGFFEWEWVLDDGTLCTTVEVQKFTGTERTVIRALGYNTCEGDNPRRTERGLRVIYRGL